MGELLGVVRARIPVGASAGTAGICEGSTYDDFEVNRLLVLDSSC
jgi:hypothetical protein